MWEILFSFADPVASTHLRLQSRCASVLLEQFRRYKLEFLVTNDCLYLILKLKVPDTTQ